MSEALHLIPYALIAALSPLGFAATITVMRTGRLKALVFAIGVLGGQLLACSVLVLIGAAAVPDHEKSHPTFQGLLELGFGLTLLVLAVAVYRRSATPAASGRSQALLDRLGRLRPVTAFAAGVLLGIGGPKRLVLTGLASASIAASGSGGSEEAALIGWYAVLATVLVWAPVLAFVLLGTRAVATLDAALQWLAGRQRQLTIWTLVIVGLLLVADGVALL